MKKVTILLLLVLALDSGILYLMTEKSEKSVVSVKSGTRESDTYLTFYGFKSGAKKIHEIEEIFEEFMVYNPKIVIAYEDDDSETYLPALMKLHLTKGQANDSEGATQSKSWKTMFREITWGRILEPLSSSL